MSSILSRFLDLKTQHDRYDAIDPKAALKQSAAGKVVFIAGASRGIGQAAGVAFTGAGAVYLTARSEKVGYEPNPWILSFSLHTLAARGTRRERETWLRCAAAKTVFHVGRGKVPGSHSPTWERSCP